MRWSDAMAQHKARKRALEEQAKAQFEAYRREMLGQVAGVPSAIRVEAEKGLVLEGKAVRKGA